jgi:hypothetical protein
MSRKGNSGTTTNKPRKPSKNQEKEKLKDFDDTIQGVVDNTEIALGQKVFIHKAYENYIKTPEGKGMTREQFNQKLIEAHRKGRIRLSRADLTSAFNFNDVQSSHIQDANSDFHFIRRSN